MRGVASILLTLPLLGCVANWSIKGDPDSGTKESEEGGTQEAVSARPEPDPTALAPSVDAGVEPLDQNPPDDIDAMALDAAVLEPALVDAAMEAAAEAAAGFETDDSAANQPVAVDAEVAVAAVNASCATPAGLACLGHNVVQKLACIGKIWTFSGACDGQTRCDTRSGVTQGTCQQIIAPCIGKRPGDPFCDGLQRKSCGPDLLTELPAQCGAHAHCDASSSSCSCDRGFAVNTAGTCQDIVDCPSGACVPGGRCIDGVESFECACDTGFQPSSDKKSCVNINDCVSNTCGPGGTCRDGINTYQCSCATGYVLSASGKVCLNPNDCPVPDPCLPGGACNDGLNAFSCSCQAPYYYPTADSRACEANPCPFGCGGY